MSLRSIGRDEGLVQPLDHGVRDLVALVLDLLDALGARFEVGRVLDHLQEGPASLHRLLSLVLEVREERRVVGQKPHDGAVYQSEMAKRSSSSCSNQALGVAGP